MNKCLYILILLLGLWLPVFSQNVVTIEECQQWAVSQSSVNVQKEFNAQLLKVKLNEASSHLYPMLEINGGARYQSQVPQLPFTIPGGVDTLSKDQYHISLDFSMVLFEGGKVFYGRQYERLLNQAEIRKLDIQIDQVKEQVIAIYLNLLIIEKQLNILSSVENTFAEQLDLFNNMYKQGVVDGNTIAQLELEALKIEQQKGALQATKESLKSSLSILTSKDLSNATFVVPQLPDVDTTTQSWRYEYDIFENQLACLDYQRKLHFSKSLPKISIYAQGGYGRPTFNIFSNKFDWFYVAGVNLNVPLIHWAKTKGVSDIINLQKSIVRSQEADFEKSNKIQIQEKLNEINRLQKLIELDNQITKKYAQITSACKTQLKNGTITTYDFIKQQNDEIQSLINQEMHSIQLLKAKYELMALKGKL